MNTEFFSITENDFVDKNGYILFTFKEDDADVDDVFRFVSKPVSEYKDVILRKEINVYDTKIIGKKFKVRCGFRFKTVREITRGPEDKQGLYFINKENAYFMPRAKYN